MALAESIFAALSGNAAIKAALGVNVAPFPIYPNRAPDGQVLPFIVHTQVSGTIDNTHSDLTQFKDSLYQFSCYATTFAAARTLRTAIINALIALDVSGLAAGEKFAIETERDIYDPTGDAHHLILEVRFFSDPTVS